MRVLHRPPFHVLVVHTGGRFYAIEDACPHSGWSLSEGALTGCELTCAGHGWVIDVRDGRVLTDVGRGEASPTFRTAVVGDEIVVYDEPAS